MSKETRLEEFAGSLESQQLGAAAIESVARLADAGKRRELQFLRPPGEPSGVYYVWDPLTGEKERRVAASPDVDESCALLSDLAFLANSALALGGEPTVYYDRKSVGAVWRNHERRLHRVSLAVNRTPEFAFLESIACREFDQRGLWNLLRSTFRSCVKKEVIRLVAKIKWSGATAASRDLAVGRESISGEVMEAVMSESALPEEIEFTVPVFELDELRKRTKRVVVALDTRVESKTFGLIPAGGELENALYAAEEDLRELLSASLSKGIPVIRGGYSEQRVNG